MLSYRHAFHAGNPGDVLKHVVLVAALEYLTAKPSDLWYVDTHAGAGVYELDTSASGRSEYRDGIGRLWQLEALPPALDRYRALVRAANPTATLTRYPGSPWFAATLLRPRDRLWLSELHATDAATLDSVMAARDRRVRVEQCDGFERLRGLLPPQPRRAFVMVDPSYEVKADYTRVVDALADARQRFATGVYAIWYPVLDRPDARGLPAALKAVAGDRWLDAILLVREPRGPGMHGSGVFVVNPPYRLADELQAALPVLADRLAQAPGATYRLDVATR